MRMQQKRRVCVLLPNKQRMDRPIRVGARASDVFQSVAEHLGIAELQMFGLAVLRDNEYLFLDLDKKLSSYFGRRWKSYSSKIQFILFLRVQFYLPRGQLIHSSEVRELYYAELRQKVLWSQSRHQEALFFQLAACALQADVGDVELGERNDEKSKQRLYFLPEDYFPPWLIKHRGRDFLLQHCPVLHVELRGLTRTQAILQFIKEANSLQDGAVVFYRMRKKKELKSSFLLGVALSGVCIYQDVEGRKWLLHDFLWTDIDRITFQGNRFEISAVGSLCLPKLVFYTPSAFHSKHVLRHLRDSHRLHINTRDAVCYLQQLEDTEASQLHREAYICDTTSLKHRPQAWPGQKEEEEEEEEFELSVDEPEEFLVDDPDEVPWLAELLKSAPVSAPLVMRSSRWAAVTMEMKQVLSGKADEGVPVD
ncbi:FERM domain-containing protein 6 isoform X2 [Takifugu rubripes]|uniref:FERM domain-containing protein 6 isoform X2 n=1 Tax=Takifugu rubripes TaxID=31033 RepID=UPI0011453C94|nr:FERM domain-containing protein 6-like isoform X2 [Takifugu rubripes]